MLDSLKSIFKIEELRKKIFFTLVMLLIFRIGAHIPISGVDNAKLLQLFGEGNLLGFLDLFTGGALMKFSIFAMGIVPYINASIIMQLLTVVVPQLERLAKEGDSGRKQISQYTRYLTVILAIFQSAGMSFWLRPVLQNDVAFPVFFISTVVTLTAGSLFVMWLGELITERGIGNGASVLIFVGIIARIPSYIGQTATLVRGGGSIFGVLLVVATMILMIAAIVFIQEGQRKVPVQYAKRIVGRKVYGGGNTYIPIRINQGGVIPIIFASSVLLFPATLAQFIPLGFMQAIASFLSPSGWFYVVLYFFLIFFFTYFYTAISFNPKELAENIKKYGGFILGIRPGKPTEEYLDFIVSRLTFLGALFLGLVAIVPNLVENLTKINTFQGLGSTALLIVVGVAMDLVKQIETHLLTRQYEGIIQ